MKNELKRYACMFIEGIEDDEIYAPDYPDGMTIRIVRYPLTTGVGIKRVNNNVSKLHLPNVTIKYVGLSQKSCSELGLDLSGDVVYLIISPLLMDV